MVMILTLAMAMSAHAGCTRGSEFEPPLCPTRLPAISTVTIEQTGAQAYPDESSPPCSKFRPTRALIQRYLKNARTTDAQSVDATLARSPCYASGKVRYADGRVGAWKIEQLLVGELRLPGREPILLYCPQCKTRPFAW